MKLIISNLRYFARSHLGTLLGVTVASAILVGALAMGDCVRESLRDLALARIGKTTFVLGSGDRFFRSALVDDLPPAAAVLVLPGTASTPDDAARANHVQILGVDKHFWEMAQTPVSMEIPPDSVALNTALAKQLRVKAGDTIILRAHKPSLLSQEAPISPREDVATGMRLTVSAVVSDAQFGRFGLQANQASPLNAFLPISWLQAKVDQPGRANLLLTTSDQKPDLKKHWTLADVGLEWRDAPGGSELRSGRVFIDPEIVAAFGSGQELILTYFVNELRDGQKTTPYFMVTAAGAPLVPPDMRDDETMISQWLADDLQAKPGDALQLTYFVLGAAQHLEQRTNKFRVRGVAPPDGPTADRTLMPDFPGIAKAEKTENWDAGFTIDMNKIRPKDEAYWKQFRGTPKAFVTLAAGRRMWGNRFGNVTGIRFPANMSRPEVEREILSKLDPAQIGLTFTAVREKALAASSQSEDFGLYFIYFSFFLIVAALILLALLFHFGLERRTTEVGILLAVGWRPTQVRRLLLLEGAAIAIVGGVLGVAGGILYAKAILFGLMTLWSAAVAESPLQFHVTCETLAIGGLSGFLISILVIWLTVWGQAKRPARELLEQGNELEREVSGVKRRRPWASRIAVVSGFGALVLVAYALAKHETSNAMFFVAAGFLFLVSGLAAAAVWLRALAALANSHSLTLVTLGVRGCARRCWRSLSIIALLASGAFIIAAVAPFKLDATRDSEQKTSGTGGFAFIGESALPIVQDLNTKAGREFFALDANSLKDVSVVSLRVHDGDDASCLNLNRAQTPRLLGGNPEALKDRFTFTQLSDKSFASNPWSLLEPSLGASEEIPAVADDTTITYGLHKKIGDTLNYTNEHGRAFKVRLVGAAANSILQGSLIVAESNLVKQFPGEAGYRMFLMDAPPSEAASVSAALSRGLRDRGLELTAAADRLNAYNAVQNTFLDTFQVLGGLGLLLGSAGLGVVVLRNVLERRSQLALLTAVGFTPRALLKLVVAEHAVLQMLGLALGIVAALLALLPVLLSPSARLSLIPLAVTLGLVFLSGLLWTWAAARLALRGELLPALRNE